MAKGKSKNDNHMSDELIKAVKVTPEQTEEFYNRTVSYTIHPRPEGVKNPKGKLFCCYCGGFKKFVNSRSNDGSYIRCETCNVSEFDYHIRNANHTWGKVSKE